VSSLNKVMLIGNLGKDPECKTTSSGKKMATFSIATSERWKDKTTGEKKEQTEWHRIVCFNENTAQFVEKYLRKGMRVLVEGMIATRKWQDQAGVDRYSTEIVVKPFVGQIISLEKIASGAPAAPESEDSYGATKASGGGGGSTKDDLDDQIPFITSDKIF
jgi:single-strand DNA-binding protein